MNLLVLPPLERTSTSVVVTGSNSVYQYQQQWQKLLTAVTLILPLWAMIYTISYSIKALYKCALFRQPYDKSNLHSSRRQAWYYAYTSSSSTRAIKRLSAASSNVYTVLAAEQQYQDLHMMKHVVTNSLVLYTMIQWRQLQEQR
eukprot:21385-Heterococcus_DN1.PRE.1